MPRSLATVPVPLNNRTVVSDRGTPIPKPVTDAVKQPDTARPACEHHAAPVIEADGVGVCYRVSDGQHKSDLITRCLRRRQPFWALRDVSFSVGHGEMFFIIGRNGAGKTTLLKLLAETLLPDAGTLRFAGDVTAFLSMGLGFQSELSGHDNLELSLTLMGVPRGDIPDKREEIRDFTQLGPFLDMPIKTYSAGMKARLGFAIATCIQPEVLIMDEVINAGDEQFRDAAKQRLAAMLGNARAIIVATHNMQQVLEQGHRAMWIESGRVQALGDAADVVQKYRRFIQQVRNDPFYDLRAREARFAGDAIPSPDIL